MLARTSLFLGAVLLLGVARSGEAQDRSAKPARKADHVVLVSIDGLRPEFYLDRTWPAPMLQQMAREGAHARKARSVFPSVTYPSHTTLVTGALPARHGVFYNLPFDPAGHTGRWYWEAKAIRVPTLWDAVRKAGGSSAALSWPVTVGAPIDRNLPEVWSTKPKAPPLGAMKQRASKGLVAELEAATGRFRPSLINLDRLARDVQFGAMAAYLIETHKPTLLAVHLVETDHFQHVQGRAGPLVRRAVATADVALGLMVEAARRAKILDRTAFVVTGDHGFVDVHTRIAPNVWLAQAGLRGAGKKGFGAGWQATFHTASGSAFLHLKDSKDAATAKRVRSLLAKLPSKHTKGFTVVEAASLKLMGAAPGAAFALAARPGFAFTRAAAGEALRAGKGGTHGYAPSLPQVHTGFVGWGSGFRKGARAARIDLTDVAPLVAELLGLPFKAPDGATPKGFLE